MSTDQNKVIRVEFEYDIRAQTYNFYYVLENEFIKLDKSNLKLINELENKYKTTQYYDLWKWITTWNDETFGTEHTYKAKLKHLGKEVQEVLDEPDPQKRRLEYADIFVLLVAACHADGIGPNALLAAVDVKMAINVTRKYNKGKGDEPSEHVR